MRTGAILDEAEIAKLGEQAKVATEKFEAFFRLFTMSSEQEKTLMTPPYFDLQRERDEAVAAVTAAQRTFTRRTWLT